MAKKTETQAATPRTAELDFVQILENTKKETQGTLDKVTGKVEMLDEIIKFFKSQKLHVIKELTEEEIAKMEEEQQQKNAEATDEAKN